MFKIVSEKKIICYLTSPLLNYNSFDINKVLEFGALLASGGQVMLFFFL